MRDVLLRLFGRIANYRVVAIGIAVAAIQMHVKGQDVAARTTVPAQVTTAEDYGDSLLAHREYHAAINAYRSSQIKSATLLNKIGVAYHHLYALEEAKANYQSAIRLKPDYPEALNNLGAVLYAEEQYKSAEKYYKKALKLTPQAASIYKNLGELYFAEKKPRKGVEAFQKALSIDSNIFDESRAQAVAMLASTKLQANLNISIAKLFARSGDELRAMEFLRKALNEGYSDMKKIMEDDDFALLRKQQEFSLLLEQAHRT